MSRSTVAMTPEDQAIWMRLMVSQGASIYPAFPEDGTDRQRFHDENLMRDIERAKAQHQRDRRGAQLAGRYMTGRRSDRIGG